MRLAILSLVLFIANSSEARAQSYPELVGMFTHGYGAITSEDRSVEYNQYAWGHEFAPLGCSDLHWWDLTQSSRPWTHFERFCIVGDWVRWMGTTVVGHPEVYLHIEYKGQLGQPYAKVYATEAYPILVDAEIVAPWGARVRYFDLQMWSPLKGGAWLQQEIWQYPDVASWEYPSFQSVVVMEPGRMFASKAHTFVSRTGLIQRSLIQSATFWGQW